MPVGMVSLSGSGSVVGAPRDRPMQVWKEFMCKESDGQARWESQYLRMRARILSGPMLEEMGPVCEGGAVSSGRTTCRTDELQGGVGR